MNDFVEAIKHGALAKVDEGFLPTKVHVHPKTFEKLSIVADSNGQYLIGDIKVIKCPFVPVDAFMFV